MPNRRILILDDHPETLELMRDIFTEEQDEVVAVSSVGPDLAEVAAYGPDLAIIDLRLSSSGSQLSGWDIVRLIKAHADMKDMRVLVISADSQELERHVGEAARLDGVQLLSKPFSLDRLLAPWWPMPCDPPIRPLGARSPMARRDDRQPDRISPADGPASHAEVEAAEALRLESVRALIREQRRTTMRARTIAITLESALDEFTSQAADGPRPDLERIELRRQWCQRALDMVQEVRAHALRTRQVFDRISAEGGLGRSAPARFAAADREIERHAERAEKAAVAGIGRQ